jgi:hypothetical protein
MRLDKPVSILNRFDESVRNNQSLFESSQFSNYGQIFNRFEQK